MTTYPFSSQRARSAALSTGMVLFLSVNRLGLARG
jgi:hypothetical protein